MPLKPGPGYWWKAQPSGQWSPVAFGPLSGPLHLRRSNTPIWPLAAAARARPHGLVGVIAELQVVRAEAGLVGGVLAGLRVVHRHPAVGAVERELLRRRVLRALLAEGGIVRHMAGRGQPDPALPVD